MKVGKFMRKTLFKAFSITNEIDLNKIADKCGIPKKFTWEEPLFLRGEVLHSILGKKVNDDQRILVFSFGSVVFINMSNTDVSKVISYLITFKPEIDRNNWNRYSDDYELHIDQSEAVHLTDKYAISPSFEPYHPELISIVIAKSVALEKAEVQLGRILDKLEGTIDRLEKGKLTISNRDLAKSTAQIVRHEYNTINYIMILDKPDVTWSNSDAAEFYDQMAEFFELNDRYEIIKKKTDILNNIIDGFSTISSSVRGLFVEWIIVILIVLEIILMVFELLR